MEANRPDAVRVAVAANIVKIGYAEWDRLLQRLRAIAGLYPIIAKTNAAHSGEPIELDATERLQLRVALEIWRNEGGMPHGGLMNLLAALIAVDG